MATLPGSNSARPSNSVPVRKFDSSELSIIRQIGNGTTSIVSLAVSNGLPVAVKTLKKEQDVSDLATRKQMKSDFANELSINLCLRHPNIIMLLGCMMTPAPSSNLKSLVFEYCNGGTLNCESHRSTKLSSTLKISIGVARALCHAHAMGIMHRDVKPSQVVLIRSPSHDDDDDDYYIENVRESDGVGGDKDGKGTSRNQATSTSLGIPKLGDWGLATFCDDSKSLHGQTGTLEFMAPEVIRRDSYGIPADVYSFGMFLFCIICAKQYPFADLYLTPTHAAIGVVKNQLRPKLNSRVPNTVSQIITMCWATDAASRPTMEIVIAMLLNALHVERRKQREKDEAETDNQPSHSNWWTWGSSSQKKSSSNSTSTDTKQTNAQSDNDEENIEPGSKPVSATSSLPSNLSQNGDN